MIGSSVLGVKLGNEPTKMAPPRGEAAGRG
jgi:hypothetical protein